MAPQFSVSIDLEHKTSRFTVGALCADNSKLPQLVTTFTRFSEQKPTFVCLGSQGKYV